MHLTCNCHISDWHSLCLGSCSSLCSVPSLMRGGQQPLHSWDAFLGCLSVLAQLLHTLFSLPVCPVTRLLHTTTISFHIMCLETFSLFRSAISSSVLCLPLLLRSTLGSPCSAGWGTPCGFFLILLWSYTKEKLVQYLLHLSPCSLTDLLMQFPLVSFPPWSAICLSLSTFKCCCLC